MDIVARGYSGYNTRWALRVLDRVFPAETEVDGGGVPLAVTVFFGANDACLHDRCCAFQHVPLPEYKQNLRSIVSYLKVYLFLIVRHMACCPYGCSLFLSATVALEKSAF